MANITSKTRIQKSPKVTLDIRSRNKHNESDCGRDTDKCNGDKSPLLCFGRNCKYRGEQRFYDALS